ncbi:MAG: hypothetical protein E6R08_06265 [Nevskiaceae bacterium]|nr:MAG: hypothetical protein E6R08_06265 [Nevskiaceae bacterium]
MNTVKEGLKKLDDCNEAVKIVEARRNEVKAEFIEKFCPVKPGAIVVVNCRSFLGKNMRVSAVFLSDLYEGKAFVCTGRVLRKDGSETGNTGRAVYNMEGKPFRSKAPL